MEVSQLFDDGILKVAISGPDEEFSPAAMLRVLAFAIRHIEQPESILKDTAQFEPVVSS